jgi:putative inorganic carbon (HCO3(-)) transporter
VFPIQTAAAAGNWALPSLSMAALAVALVLASDWPWLRGFMVVFAGTLVLAWARTPDAHTSTPHFAGASLGLLSMTLVGRFADSHDRLRVAMLAFLGGGLVVLIVGVIGADFEKLAPFAAPLTRLLPTVSLGLAGLEKGHVNPNALAASALLIAPLGASILVLRTDQTFDRLALLPLACVVLVTGLLVLTVSQSRSGWLAVWLTLVALLVFGLRSRVWRLVLGAAVVAPVLVAGASVFLLARETFLLHADKVWSTVHLRGLIMLSGLDRLSESPWLGIGLNQFRTVYALPLPVASTSVGHAHNILLQVALDIGVFGLAAYVCILGFLLMHAVRITRGQSTLASGAAAGAALSLVAVTAFGLADAVALGAKVGLFQWAAGGLILSAGRVNAAGAATRPADSSRAISDPAAAGPMPADARVSPRAGKAPGTSPEKPQ